RGSSSRPARSRWELPCRGPPRPLNEAASYYNWSRASFGSTAMPWHCAGWPGRAVISPSSSRTSPGSETPFTACGTWENSGDWSSNTSVPDMPDAIITLATDFGEDSPYVAAMKGVILGINPAARIVDLGHQIPPQDLRHAAHFLAGSLP